MLIAAVVIVSVVVAFAVVRSGFSSWTRAQAGTVVPDRPSSWSSPPESSRVEPTAAVETAHATPVAELSPVRAIARDDPPATYGGRAEIQQTSVGTACRGTAMESEYGSYPLAKCRMWQRSAGLLSGETLAKGSATVTCQRDLARPNPQYTTGQSNTWWIWTKSDAGTWDWFPETAVAEGTSDQPINGIALCRA